MDLEEKDGKPISNNSNDSNKEQEPDMDIQESRDEMDKLLFAQQHCRPVCPRLSNKRSATAPKRTKSKENNLKETLLSQPRRASQDDARNRLRDRLREISRDGPPDISRYFSPVTFWNVPQDGLRKPTRDTTKDTSQDFTRGVFQGVSREDSSKRTRDESRKKMRSSVEKILSDSIRNSSLSGYSRSSGGRRSSSGSFSFRPDGLHNSISVGKHAHLLKWFDELPLLETLPPLARSSGNESGSAYSSKISSGQRSSFDQFDDEKSNLYFDSKSPRMSPRFWKLKEKLEVKEGEFDENKRVDMTSIAESMERERQRLLGRSYAASTPYGALNATPSANQSMTRAQWEIQRLLNQPINVGGDPYGVHRRTPRPSEQDACTSQTTSAERRQTPDQQRKPSDPYEYPDVFPTADRDVSDTERIERDLQIETMASDPHDTTPIRDESPGRDESVNQLDTHEEQSVTPTADASFKAGRRSGEKRSAKRTVSMENNNDGADSAPSDATQPSDRPHTMGPTFFDPRVRLSQQFPSSSSLSNMVRQSTATITSSTAAVRSQDSVIPNLSTWGARQSSTMGLHQWRPLRTTFAPWKSISAANNYSDWDVDYSRYSFSEDEPLPSGYVYPEWAVPGKENAMDMEDTSDDNESENGSKDKGIPAWKYLFPFHGSDTSSGSDNDDDDDDDDKDGDDNDDDDE